MSKSTCGTCEVATEIKNLYSELKESRSELKETRNELKETRSELKETESTLTSVNTTLSHVRDHLANQDKLIDDVRIQQANCKAKNNNSSVTIKLKEYDEFKTKILATGIFSTANHKMSPFEMLYGKSIAVASSLTLGGAAIGFVLSKLMNEWPF